MSERRNSEELLVFSVLCHVIYCMISVGLEICRLSRLFCDLQFRFSSSSFTFKVWFFLQFNWLLMLSGSHQQVGWMGFDRLWCRSRFFAVVTSSLDRYWLDWWWDLSFIIPPFFFLRIFGWFFFSFTSHLLSYSSTYCVFSTAINIIRFLHSSFCF